jgi:hypothetical protein
LADGLPVQKSEIQSSSSRRVNAPYFDGDVRFSETAIFWLGRVTTTENYADVRVGYNDDLLYVHAAVIDRRHWYDTSPSAEELIDWDSVTLLLDMDGNVGDSPDANAYRFDAQLDWWEPRDDYQAAYQGDGSGWLAATIPFTTTSTWRSLESTPNDNEKDDRGWFLRYLIPFESLGLDGPPAPGTAWGLALALHDRDDAEGTPIADQVWPEAMHLEQPTTWGQLAFGMPAYTPLPALLGDTVTIRHGLDGATVLDADVGGSSVCGGSAWPDYFPTWGELNYGGKDFLNIQNLGDIGDWPCFAKTYLTFPLDPLPAGKAIISATLTLFLWGGAGEGEDPGPKASLIQVLTVDEDWDEETITWNDAPLALENVSATWVDPVESYPGRPGIPYQWDISRAVAEAYGSGIPLRLSLYESDWAYHSGKYFDSSDVDEWGQAGRPTLRVTWGDILPDVTVSASLRSGVQDDHIAYELSFFGTGAPLALTDTLPVGVSAPLNFGLSGTSVSPSYDGVHHRLVWSDSPAAGVRVTISYDVVITTPQAGSLVNTVELRYNGGAVSTASATVCANCYAAYVPLVVKESVH